jgi:Serine/Threonine/Tyrosine Kinase found in polyvalent proteins
VKDLISFKHELQNIINGTITAGENQLIKTIQTYLGKNFASGKNAEEEKQSREQEEKSLINFATKSDLWISSDQFGSYVTEGAEQKVYYPGNTDYIIKVSDAIFYKNWKDYFDNLLIHNHLFPDTAYTLLGFFDSEKKLFAVLKQQFVQADETTNLDTVRKFMENNGFILKKNNDYYHPYLGIIIEDLHDENVLTGKGVFFFIDTVIYLTEDFYK